MPRTLTEAEFNAIKAAVLRELPDGMDEAAFQRQMAPRMAAAVAEAEHSPEPVDDSAAWRFVSNAAAMLNPVAMAKGVFQAVRHPIDTATGVVSQMGEEWRKAGDLAEQGRYLEAGGHAVAGSLPLVGPTAARVGEQIAGGDVAGGLGATAGLLLPAAGAEALRNRRVSVSFNRNSPVEADAVAFGRAHQVPIDAGTGTGSAFVKNVQKKVGSTWGGAQAAETMRGRQAAALTRVGDDLAGRVNATTTGPGPAVDGLNAGAGVRTALDQQIGRFDRAATAAYTKVRAFEADPARLPAMQVDVTSVKSGLKPLYDELARRHAVVPFTEGAQARALRALDALMQAPERAPLSLMESILGDLKGMARGADLPELRTAGQGTAAAAVRQLQHQIDLAAKRAGSDVFSALEQGRRATASKYGVAEVRDLFSQQALAEPRKLFEALTAKKDGGIERLNAVAQHAPDQMPQVGRAVIEDLLNRATEAGKFEHTDALFADWQKLGPQTRRLLFGGVTPDLDRFFLLAKKINENVNPSGTAVVLNATQLVAGLPSWALSRVLFSDTGVKALNRGLTLATGPGRTSKAAAASAQAAILNALREAGVPMSAVPAAASDAESDTRPAARTPQ